MDRLISSFVPCCTLEHNCRFFFKFNSLDNLRTPKNHEFEVLKTSIHKIPAVFKCMFTKLILDPSLAHHSSFEWIVNITSWCNEDYILKLKKNFVLMNNLVNIAEFSKKQTHQKHITWKATLYNSWIKTITGLWTHYSVRTKRYKMDPFIILYPA